MNEPRTSDQPTRDDYVVEFHREMSRLLAGQNQHPLGEDVAQTECIKLIEHLDLISDSYPNPITYARARVRHACIDYDRRQAVQRGEGARLVTDSDGSVRRSRLVVSGDIPHPVTGRTIFDVTPAADPTIDEIIERSDDRLELLRGELAKLSPAARHLVLAVKGEGRTVTEVAATLGVGRTVASKLLNTALGDIYEAIDQASRC